MMPFQDVVAGRIRADDDGPLLKGAREPVAHAQSPAECGIRVTRAQRHDVVWQFNDETAVTRLNLEVAQRFEPPARSPLGALGRDHPPGEHPIGWIT